MSSEEDADADAAAALESSSGSSAPVAPLSLASHAHPATEEGQMAWPSPPSLSLDSLTSREKVVLDEALTTTRRLVWIAFYICLVIGNL